MYDGAVVQEGMVHCLHPRGVSGWRGTAGIYSSCTTACCHAWAMWSAHSLGLVTAARGHEQRAMVGSCCKRADAVLLCGSWWRAEPGGCGRLHALAACGVLARPCSVQRIDAANRSALSHVPNCVLTRSWQPATTLQPDRADICLVGWWCPLTCSALHVS
jgi:hypothetical protein